MGASIREVAAEAKVSLGTVSKVLNNSANSQIAPATRQRVLDAVQRTGYHPSAIARGLTGKRMNTLGLVMAYDQPSVTSDAYLGPCLDGILQVSKRHRQKTVVFTEDSWADALCHVSSYCDGHCDALMLVIPRLDSIVIEELQIRGTKFLLVGDSRADDNLVAVDVDNHGAAKAMTRYLLTLGHRRIAVFCGYTEFCSNGQRLDGYHAAFADAALPVPPDFVFPGEYRRASGYANMQSLLEHFPPALRPTAVFAFSDQIALGAMDALRENGIAVPGEMSVVGFDDIAAAALHTPALTTVHQPVRNIGSRAAEILLAQIEGTIPLGHRELVPAEIIVRASAAPPPS